MNKVELMTKKTPEEIKDTQPFQTIPEDKETKVPKSKKKLVSEILKKSKTEPKSEFSKRQVEMTGSGFEKPKRQRVAVWTQNGSRKWGRLRHLLHQIVIDGKKNDLSDIEVFCLFADNKEVQKLFKSHPNESVRNWTRDKIIDSARTRMKQDLEAIIKDKDIPAVTKASDLPDFYPKSLLDKGKKRNPLTEYLVRAGGMVK